MKYVWLIVVIIGIVGIYLGIQRYQLQHTEAFGEYPCFMCSAVEPDFEVIAFSALECPSCDQAVQRTQRFCRLTGGVYGNTYYDNAGETQQKLNELSLQKNSQFLVVVLSNSAIIGTSTETEHVESFLSDVVKEAFQL